MTVAVVRKGDFYIYAYDLIDALADSGIDVTALLSIDKSEENIIYDDLLTKIQGKARVIRLADWPKRFYLRLKGLFGKLRLSSDSLIVSPYLIRKTRKEVRGKQYDYIIAAGQESLYWAYQTFKKDRARIIYYNLEIIYQGHPVTADPTWARIVAFEHRILSRIGGVIIQDEFRSKVLLGDIEGFDPAKRIFFPVAINEPKVLGKGSYFTRKFGLGPANKVVLYYGGIWPGRSLQEVIDATAGMSPDIKVVIHGGRGSFDLHSDQQHIIVSKEKLLFSQVTDLISSADIGLAFYSADNFNDQYTAWSSEKISRYCQCGKPFIAFGNDNYLAFKAQYDCCVLIQGAEDLPGAIKTILSNYDYYQNNAYRAFDNEFDFQRNLGKLLAFMKR
jgi:hypothetical protein